MCTPLLVLPSYLKRFIFESSRSPQQLYSIGLVSFVFGPYFMYTPPPPWHIFIIAHYLQLELIVSDRRHLRNVH